MRVVDASTGSSSWVVASVQDDGAGIAEADLPYLFDPFFTTRIHEGGTGLGLSICHGIVREQGGQIEVRTAPDCGSTFRVELPSSA